MDKPSYVYMLASRPYGTLYIGVTSDLIKRTWQHKEAQSQASRNNTTSNAWSGTKSTPTSPKPSCAKNSSNAGTATGRST